MQEYSDSLCRPRVLERAHSSRQEPKAGDAKPNMRRLQARLAGGKVREPGRHSVRNLGRYLVRYGSQGSKFAAGTCTHEIVLIIGSV